MMLNSCFALSENMHLFMHISGQFPENFVDSYCFAKVFACHQEG